MIWGNARGVWVFNPSLYHSDSPSVSSVPSLVVLVLCISDFLSPSSRRSGAVIGVLIELTTKVETFQCVRGSAIVFCVDDPLLMNRGIFASWYFPHLDHLEQLVFLAFSVSATLHCGTPSVLLLPTILPKLQLLERWLCLLLDFSSLRWCMTSVW